MNAGRDNPIPHPSGATILALIGSLALISSGAKKAEAFENNREFLWNKMLSCQFDRNNCQDVHSPQPSQCVQGPRGQAPQTSVQCDASYVVTKPDATTQPHPNQTLLIPGSGSITAASTTARPNYPVTGIEAYKSSDTNTTKWLPNYFAYAASFAVAHYGGGGTKWVVVSMNSANTRTQDQMHLHMCDLNTAISISRPSNADVWTDTGLKVGPNVYYVMRLSKPVTATDAWSNPFTKVFMPEAPTGGVGGARPSQKADVTLALVISPRGTNYLLYNLDGGAAESLLPQGVACAFK